MQYSEELLRACGIAVLCSLVLVIVGKFSLGIGAALRVAGGVLIFGIFLTILSANIGELEKITSLPILSRSSYLSKSISLMLKALGITLLSKFCADICRDCGESALAGGVESVGRIVIFSLCIPIIFEIIEYASEVMSMGG